MKCDICSVKDGRPYEEAMRRMVGRKNEHPVCERDCDTCSEQDVCPDKLEYSHSRWADEVQEKTEDDLRDKYRIN